MPQMSKKEDLEHNESVKRIMAARDNYRNLPSGYMDETDLLLMSSLRSIEAKPAPKKKKAKPEGGK